MFSISAPLQLRILRSFHKILGDEDCVYHFAHEVVLNQRSGLESRDLNLSENQVRNLRRIQPQQNGAKRLFKWKRWCVEHPVVLCKLCNCGNQRDWSADWVTPLTDPPNDRKHTSKPAAHRFEEACP